MTIQGRRLLYLVCSCCLGGLFVLAALHGLSPPNAHAGSFTVCPSGPPICAFSSIQAAVDAASAGTTIKIAAGTYSDLNSRGGLAQIVYVDKSVTLRGGYSETFVEPPDPTANPSILDAQGLGRVIFVAAAAAPSIEGLRLIGGNADVVGGEGGGLYAASPITLVGNSFVANYATYGGGLYLAGDGGTLSDNAILLNSAADSGGGIYLNQGIVWLTNNIISGNVASFNLGGGVLAYLSQATLDRNMISHNSAGSLGGGVSLVLSRDTLSGNQIVHNSARSGGGVAIYGATPPNWRATLNNNVISDNQVTQSGGGLAVYQTTAARGTHNTLAANRGGDGSGISVTGFGGFFSTLVMTNTILAAHTLGIWVDTANTARLEATLWGSDAWANGTDWSGGGTIVTGTINLRAAPVFVDPATGNYRIGVGSAAIDAGVDAGITSDIDGDLRPLGAGFDIGADEFYDEPGLRLPIIYNTSAY